MGLIPRLLMVYLVVSRNNFSRKEKIFLMLSWIPKATVQVLGELNSSVTSYRSPSSDLSATRAKIDRVDAKLYTEQRQTILLSRFNNVC